MILAGLIWRVADLLRGDYKPADYGEIILPFTILRRLECVLQAGDERTFSNHTGITLRQIAEASTDPVADVHRYIAGFSPNIREVLLRYRLPDHVARLAEADLLRQVVARFSDLDLHPSAVSNNDMGDIFEDLIRRFSESNGAAGEHYTPREVVALMAALVVDADPCRPRRDEKVAIYDPACGTGGMLTAAADHLRGDGASIVELFGQELNPESWAVCRSEFIIRSEGEANLGLGNSLTADAFPDARFDYMLSNPPFGVEWHKVRTKVRKEHDELGSAGRFGAGLPRVNDGSLLFLQHMLARMKSPADGGSRIGVIFSGSPLYTGAAGSGESEIRRWLIESDYLETIVALPEKLFCNTGIGTYIWILSNRKEPHLRGKVVLMDARDRWARMDRSWGEKRRRMTDADIASLVTSYRQCLSRDSAMMRGGPAVRVVEGRDFGYQRIVVERPLRLRFAIDEVTLAATRQLRMLDRFESTLKNLLGSRWETAQDAVTAVRAAALHDGLVWPTSKTFVAALRNAIGVREPQGEIQMTADLPEPDPELRETEHIPLATSADAYVEEQIRPFVADAWIDLGKTRIGYEVPFASFFVVPRRSRSLAEVDSELASVEAEIEVALERLTFRS